jgi:FkbM family methyltransferase
LPCVQALNYIGFDEAIQLESAAIAVHRPTPPMTAARLRLLRGLGRRLPGFRGRGLVLRTVALALALPRSRTYEVEDRQVGPLLARAGRPGPSRDAFFGVRLDSALNRAAEFLQAGDIVIDVGANFGGTARLFAAAVGPTGRVHAFEPNPGVFDLLEANAARAPHRNMDVQMLALGASPGEAPLWFPEGGNDGMVNLAGRGSVIGTTRVGTLDQLDLTPTLLKIDAENWDGRVLAGGRATTTRMAKRRSMILVEANWDAGAEEIEHEVQLLRRQGFVIWLDDRRQLRPWTGDRVPGNLVLIANGADSQRR